MDPRLSRWRRWRSARSAPQLVGLVLAGLLGTTSASADPHPILTVAIDPGHGGSNLGAAGVVEGVVEKKLTLAIARLLRKRLERDGITVIQTRDADVYVTLAERVRRANAANADVFVSLHANATPDHHSRGFDAYVLAREVRDIEARTAGATATDAIDGLLARARVRHVARESSRLASAVRAHLGQVQGGGRPTRQAPFDVLENLRMPAALVEVGHIDHPVEGRDLLQPETLHHIADAIADGIEAFQVRDDPR